MAADRSGPGAFRASSRWAALLAGALVLGACDEAVTGPEPEVEFSCAGPTSVVVDGETIPVAPGGYATVGNRIVAADGCSVHRFAGVTRPGLHYFDDPRMLDADSAAADFARIRAWGANVVRLTVSQNYWVPSARWYDPAYPGIVDRAVRQARSAGLDVILALQTSDRGDPAYPGNRAMQQQMPDANHSIPFWRDVASRYKGDGGVMFELYSEPYFEPQPEQDWNVWLKGGWIPEGVTYDENRAGYQAAGMQQLYDVVRAAGADNLVLVSGTHWGYYLDGVPDHAVKGYNIAYAAHPWDWTLKRPALWDDDWGFLAKTAPVVITEFGDYTCNSTGYVSAVLDYADRHELGWVAWAWTAPGADDPDRQKRICEYPMLLRDWSGTPSGNGQLVKDRMATY